MVSGDFSGYRDRRLPVASFCALDPFHFAFDV